MDSLLMLSSRRVRARQDFVVSNQSNTWVDEPTVVWDNRYRQSTGSFLFLLAALYALRLVRK